MSSIGFLCRTNRHCIAVPRLGQSQRRQHQPWWGSNSRWLARPHTHTLCEGLSEETRHRACNDVSSLSHLGGRPLIPAPSLHWKLSQYKPSEVRSQCNRGEYRKAPRRWSSPSRGDSPRLRQDLRRIAPTPRSISVLCLRLHPASRSIHAARRRFASSQIRSAFSMLSRAVAPAKLPDDDRCVLGQTCWPRRAGKRWRLPWFVATSQERHRSTADHLELDQEVSP